MTAEAIAADVAHRLLLSIEEIDSALNRITHRLRATGERELDSREVGEAVMAELRTLDGIAYVRFASVYRDFQDISEFQAEIQKLNTDLD